MPLPRRTALLGTALALLGLAAMPATAQERGVTIGFVTTLTTPAGAIGRDMQDAVNLALEHVGGQVAGKPLKVIFEDDGLRPETGRQKVEKLVRQDEVDIVAGFIWSNVLLAARRPALDAGKFLISTNAGPSEMAGKQCHENFFSTRGQNDMVHMALAEQMNRRGVKSLYAIVPNYAAGKDNFAGVQRTFKGKILGSDFTRWGDDPQLDFSAELAKAKASGAEALYMFYPGRAAAFMPQYQQSGLAGVMPTYSGYTLDQLALPRLKQAGITSALGQVVADYWAPDLDNAANKRFVTDFKARYGRIPSNYAAAAYDLIPYVKSAVEAAGGDVTKTEAVRKGLEAADYDSVRGRYSVGTNHFPIDTYYGQEIVAGPDGEWTTKTIEAVMTSASDPYVAECKLGS